jgi:hypothetical protein
VATSCDERDEFDDEFEDDNPREGQQVYEAWFDSDGIGSGGNYVYLFRGKYYFVTEETQSEAQDTLEYAIFAGAGDINACCSRITCPSIKSEELVRMLTVHDDTASVEINGERWVYDQKTGWAGPNSKPSRRKKPRTPQKAADTAATGEAKGKSDLAQAVEDLLKALENRAKRMKQQGEKKKE